MVKIGMAGVGDISGIYLENITNMFKEIAVEAVCDPITEKAANAQAKWNIPKLYADMNEMFADNEIDIVLNLTRPYEHYNVTKTALLAGKHVYSEKPLAATVPDPNGFGGPVFLLRRGESSFKEMPLLFDYPENSRGLGLADMAKALTSGRTFRADCQQTYHVLDVMTAFERSSISGCREAIRSPFEKKEPMVYPPVKGILD